MNKTNMNETLNSLEKELNENNSIQKIKTADIINNNISSIHCNIF